MQKKANRNVEKMCVSNQGHFCCSNSRQTTKELIIGKKLTFLLEFMTRDSEVKKVIIPKQKKTLIFENIFCSYFKLKQNTNLRTAAKNSLMQQHDFLPDLSVCDPFDDIDEQTSWELKQRSSL